METRPLHVEHDLDSLHHAHFRQTQQVVSPHVGDAARPRFQANPADRLLARNRRLRLTSPSPPTHQLLHSPFSPPFTKPNEFAHL
jgi:hypothetical protein